MIIIVAIGLNDFDRFAFAADPTLYLTSFICLSELALAYSICSANFAAFRRLTMDIRTNFGGFASGVHSSYAKSGTGYIRSDGGLESDTFPMTAGAAIQLQIWSPTSKQDRDSKMDDSRQARSGDASSRYSTTPVSYTHLTLPTNREV